jgi:hypothetical protein
LLAELQKIILVAFVQKKWLAGRMLEKNMDTFADVVN